MRRPSHRDALAQTARPRRLARETYTPPGSALRANRDTAQSAPPVAATARESAGCVVALASPASGLLYLVAALASLGLERRRGSEARLPTTERTTASKLNIAWPVEPRKILRHV